MINPSYKHTSKRKCLPFPESVIKINKQIKSEYDELSKPIHLIYQNFPRAMG